jgi:molybdate transport system ATP-binding protein
MLELQVRKRLGEFTLEAELSVPPGGSLVLVGESGSGKTTLLRLIAGLLAPDRGRIAVGGRVLADTTSNAWVPPQSRRVGLVAQDYALFPHLTVKENVAFGLEARGVSAPEAAMRVGRELERLRIADLAGRRPHELSGGQQQRVALARALVPEPDVLLLDEPLAALDQRTRRHIRAELVEVLASTRGVSIFVTHHPAEALVFGEHIGVLEAGRLTQSGPREELLHRPRTRYVADFLGTNLFEARVTHRDATGLAHLAAGGGEIVAAECEPDGAVFAVVDPREITLADDAPAGSAQNVLVGEVVDLQPEPPRGDRVRVGLATRPPLVAELTRAAAERLALAPGRRVWASFKATGVRVFQ